MALRTKIHGDYDLMGSSMHAVAGGYSSGFLPLNRAGREDVFSSGLWNNEALPMLDVTDVANQWNIHIYLFIWIRRFTGR